MTYIPLDRMLTNNGDLLGGGQPIQKIASSVFRSPWIDNVGTMSMKGAVMVQDITRGITTVISNSAAETAIYSPSQTPNDLFTSSRMGRVTVYGTILNNSGVAQTVTIKPRVNSASLANDVSVSLAASAAPRPFMVEGLFYSPDGVNVRCVGFVTIGPPNASTQGTALDFGVAAPALYQPFIGANVTLSPINAAVNLDFSFQMSGGGVTTTVNRELGMLEIVSA